MGDGEIVGGDWADDGVVNKIEEESDNHLLCKE